MPMRTLDHFSQPLGWCHLHRQPPVLGVGVMTIARRQTILLAIIALALISVLTLVLAFNRSAQAQTETSVTVREQTVEIKSLAPGATFEVKAPCDAGEVAAGGGFRIAPGSGLRAYLSAPTPGTADGWQTGFANGSSPTRAITVTAYAVCAPGSAVTPTPTPTPTPAPTPTPTPEPTPTRHNR
jgi:hypothetical protein